jgi:hypothetical protein
MATLFWTADSPFCRITLWAMAILNRDADFNLKHLTWDELRSISAGGQLGTAATVPCLTLPSGQNISDSLRIIAHLLQTDFYRWFLSSEGDHYRMIEGQFSRIMYALYDGAQGKNLEKVHGQWQRALRSAELTLTKNTSTSLLPSAALHVFVTFCLMLRPEWRSDISEPLAQLLTQQEGSIAFQKLQSWTAATHYRVPCSWTEPVR